MLRRDQFGFPSFWLLQIAGWGTFYLLTLVSFLPSLGPHLIREAGMFVALMFLTSCLLRPVCRSLMRRALSWMALETRGFVWSLLAGGIAGLVLVLLSYTGRPPSWGDWLVTAVQAAIMLFFWCSLYFSIKQWQQSAGEREMLLRAEAEARDARLSALRYQLNPHFLFNSLNAVSTLVLDGKATAATRMLAQIGELLRTILDSEALPEAPLSWEIAVVERYLAIEQTRLGDRLRVEMSIAPETLDALVPSMLLQPLVENAVRHGVAPLIEGGTIRVRSELNDGRLQVRVRNSGMPTARSAQTGVPAGARGIGLGNTAARLQTLYGADHKFELQWPQEGGCEVIVELPYRKAVLQPGMAACVP